MAEQVPHMLRADARENRERLLEAARRTLSEKGLDVTMREVARQAGVGPATLYRRFPSKSDLVSAAFADEMRVCETLVERASADPDAWRGFRALVTELCILQATHRGFTEVFLETVPGEADAFAEHRSSLLRRVSALARRARAQGAMRADFVLDDLLLVLLAGRALSTTPADRREAAARRLAALALEAFRASDDNGTLPPRPRLAAALLSAP
ncbi:TetR/AcrR family transcriptional regulator [Microbacterium sp. RD1]|uniref:TetR/AcrR family transcriptional regulator n=1 Tax=Microbacterium sp. RD1 TaxID=3457313 RepID=UPI003FA58C09